MEQYAGYLIALVGLIILIVSWIYIWANREADLKDYLGTLDISTYIQIADFVRYIGAVLIVIGVFVQAGI